MGCRVTLAGSSWKGEDLGVWPSSVFTVHWSLEALARSWLAASVVSLRSVMVKAENRFCGQWMDGVEWGQNGVSPFPSLASLLSPSHLCPPHPQVQGHRRAQVADHILLYGELML